MGLTFENREIPQYQSNEEVMAIVNGFKDKTLPKSQWTHTAHLVIALYHLLRYNASDALDIIRTNIYLYNEASGTENSNSGGFHETITRFYVHAVRKFILETCRADEQFVDQVNRLIWSEIGAKTFPLRYYSREVLMSVRSRRIWTEPDILPLEHLPEHIPLIAQEGATQNVK